MVSPSLSTDPSPPLSEGAVHLCYPTLADRLAQGKPDAFTHCTAFKGVFSFGGIVEVERQQSGLNRSIGPRVSGLEARKV